MHSYNALYTLYSVLFMHSTVLKLLLLLYQTVNLSIDIDIDKLIG